MTDIMQVLKRETAANHESIEEKMTVMRPDFTLADYKVMLTNFWKFYEPYETIQAKNEYPEELEIEKRRKLPALKADLEFFGLTPSRDKDLVVPNMASLARRLGVLYVTEGSTLGGQVISRHLSQALGLDRGAGLSFFSGYEKETGVMWQRLGAVMRFELEKPDEIDAAVRAANETFSALERCF